MLHGQPAEILAPVHPAMRGGLVYQGFKFERDGDGDRFGAPDLVGVMLGKFTHRNNMPYYRKARAKSKRATKTISITVPENLLPEIDRECARQGRNRSNWLIWIVRNDLEKIGASQNKS